MTDDTHSASHLDRRIACGWWFGVAVALGVVWWAESERWQSLSSEQDPLPWLFDMNVDSTPFALLFVVLPVCWIVRRPILNPLPRWCRVISSWLSGSSKGPAVVLAGLVAVTAFFNCWRIAATPFGPHNVAFADLPPAFHDEFSYLFQAETLQLGTWSVSSHPTAARLFDQVHVLNEGRFASRYFPGAGGWIAGWQMLGVSPVTSYWIATAITTVLIFAIGRELSNNGVGLLAGLLVAVSPGMNLFGSLLLAHQPTLVGLSVFLWSFIRLQRRLETVSKWSWLEALLAGLGLSFAMLCRPMTAAGIGLPFGIWLLRWLIGEVRNRRAVLVVVLGFAVPLLAALGLLAWQNHSITGRAVQTPYGLYTELFTPRHMYGFNNVVRAEPLLTDRVLDHYDRWAENLTPSLALQNVGMRCLASWLWTLGLVALAVSLTVFVAAKLQREHERWLLILAAIVSLHAVHIPYWYDGIFHWHYVFESGPLWCLIAAEAAGLLVAWFLRSERQWMVVWWSAVLVVSVSVNQFAMSPFWTMARVQAGLGELAFSKLKHAEFRAVVNQSVAQRPAIVLVQHDPADRHIDYVTNSPRLDAPVLIGRLPAAGMSITDTVRLAQSAFPDRAIYVFDIPHRSLRRAR